MVHLNWLPHTGTDFYGVDDIFIPLRLWVKDENRYLTFREMIDLGEYWFSNMQRYRRLAVDVCATSEQDIEAAAAEIDERVRGSRKTAEEDEDLQSRCRLLISAIGRPQNEVGMRIAAQFLRTNLGLFE